MSQQIDIPDLKITITLIGTLLFFYMYYYSAHSEFLENKIDKSKKGIYEIKLFLTRKLMGFLFLGLIPGILYFIFIHPETKVAEFFTCKFSSVSVIIFLLVAIICLVVYINQKSNPQQNSLQIKISDWNLSLFGINAIGWIIYLLAYEFLFRGILLFECYYRFGFWPAIAINIVIYSAIHMINSKDEAIGALVFGSIACYFTLTEGTILIPFFMHIALSLFSDYFSIRLNKDLRFVKSGTLNLLK